MRRGKIDGMALFAFFLCLFFLLSAFRDRSSGSSARASLDSGMPAVKDRYLKNRDEKVREESQASQLLVVADTSDRNRLDPDAIRMPYDEYAVTQGLHGFEYGHMALDISAGKGAQLKSPINGVVTAFYTDPVGSPILIIENQRWQVTLVHAIFTVSLGEYLLLGQVIGVESNQGNTVDMEGRPCRNRDCGYHTHINIFDKPLGQNVNPLVLFPDNP